MPDNRKHIIVEPETHQEFMGFTVENRKTQDSGLNYLLRFHKSVKKADKALADKIKFNLN
jgi:hypothetical protein